MFKPHLALLSLPHLILYLNPEHPNPGHNTVAQSKLRPGQKDQEPGKGGRRSWPVPWLVLKQALFLAGHLGSFEILE